MTKRFLLVSLDDDRPLGPQLAGARLWGIPWKLLRQLSGGYTVRHLSDLATTSDFCERQSVRWGVKVLPPIRELAPMAFLSPGGGPVPGVMRPDPIQMDDAAQMEAVRQEQLAEARALGRSDTILTKYALATTTPTTAKTQLGA